MSPRNKPCRHRLGSRCVALPCLTSVLDGDWSAPRAGYFIPGKESRYPLYRRLGGSQGRSGRFGEEKISCTRLCSKTEPSTPVASRYTDCAIPAGMKTV